MAKITQEQKNKLRKFLGQEIVTADEKREIREVKDNVSKMNDDISKSMISVSKELDRKISKIQNTDLTPVIESLNKLADVIIKNHKPVDYSGFFKDFGTQLVQNGKTSKDTKDLITNLKWNVSMGVRNQNGSPISPSVSPFQLPDWNDVVLSGYDANNNPSTVTYKLGGQTVAIITLSYDGSGNLLEAKKTG